MLPRIDIPHLWPVHLLPYKLSSSSTMISLTNISMACSTANSQTNIPALWLVPLSLY
uniref:Uncharacterized protein n=1 Tax=Anguilla anguilla TaxID=7936 RepID=A0A0E9XRD8_ANGAN